MVSAANPLAAIAGSNILKAGGNALDAAIAAQMVLNVVEPQSSGIGGGGFLMHFDSKSGVIDSYDGRETAPKSATPKMFLQANGIPMEFFDAVTGGTSVGVPGLLKMLEQAHRDHGKLPWPQLFKPAIKLAKSGFKISKRLARLIAVDKYLKLSPSAKYHFYNANGSPKKEGENLKNPELALTLEKVAAHGADGFYKGSIASSIIASISQSIKNPSGMNLSDIANYKAMKRDPLCSPYRIWLICGMPPPSSGGVTTLQILGLLQRFNFSNFEPMTLRPIHLISEASALAFADRNIYVADPDQIPVPTAGMIDPEYLKLRSNEISVFKAKGRRHPGMPGHSTNLNFSPDEIEKGLSTTHISIIDKNGNSVSMTSSIENVFGSRIMVKGFLLNNQLTDFSFKPEENGVPVANSVGPGKRPRSSMSPTFIFDDSKNLIMAIGSPGGSKIIGYVIKTIVATLDWGMNINDAINSPNFTNRNGPITLEKGTPLEGLKPKLEKMGHKVKISSQESGLQGVFASKEGLKGGSDNRREGISIGSEGGE